MDSIFINLKRFDVPRSMGGLCPGEEPDQWIQETMQGVVDSGLCSMKDLRIVFFLPEALIMPALEQIEKNEPAQRANIAIGSQGVFRTDVEAGGNFGAFTTNLPAKAAANLGATWAIVGHSEERADKLGIIEAYDPDVKVSAEKRDKALEAVNTLINNEVVCALKAGLNVNYCVGETAAERGEGTFEEQKPRIEKALRQQLRIGLTGVPELLEGRDIVIGYEPIWAIGPGKTPPDEKYIGFVSDFIKREVEKTSGISVDVVYGGGLKKENAGGIGGIDTIDGGLIALTKFTPPISFSVEEFVLIVNEYLLRGK